MSIIYIMIPLALVLVAVAVGAMIWAVRTGQFDELESHGWTPVLDDDERPIAQPDVGNDADDADHPDRPESTGDSDRP